MRRHALCCVRGDCPVIIIIVKIIIIVIVKIIVIIIVKIIVIIIVKIIVIIIVSNNCKNCNLCAEAR